MSYSLDHLSDGCYYNSSVSINKFIKSVNGDVFMLKNIFADNISNV